MVVRISTGKSIRGALHYNERKVNQGKADLIFSSKFACDTDDLTFRQKLKRFQSLTDRSTKVKTNTLHISLNFSPGEDISLENLQQISFDYMNSIGFGRQPFLVYEHLDAAHPHLHIVTTNVQANGKAISLHNIARNKSEPARKAIERDYNLIVAEGRREGIGKNASIIEIISRVTDSHLYTTFDELNALLLQHNIVADAGVPGTLLHERRGLIYSQLDEHGGKSGIPIPASEIPSFPGRNFIERKMLLNGLKILPVQNRIRKIIEQASSNMALYLQRNRISCHPRHDHTGQLTDVILVDKRTRAAVSLSNLNYNPAEFYHRLNNDTLSPEKTPPNIDVGQMFEKAHLNIDTTIALYQQLLATESAGNNLSPEFLKKRKKKRRRH